MTTTFGSSGVLDYWSVAYSAHECSKDAHEKQGNDRFLWVVCVNQIWWESGVMDMMVEELQLQKLQTTIRMDFNQSISSHPLHSNESNMSRILTGVSKMTLQQDYDQALSILIQ